MDELLDCVNNFDKLMKARGKMIERIGDCPNIEAKVFEEPIFWKSIRTMGEYTCQVNSLSGKARIVSANHIRKAQGSRNAMLEKLERLAAPDFMKPGDVIGVSRKGLYEHYAVYLGNHRVIHYCGQGDDFGGKISIHEADFKEFIKDSKGYFVVWFDNGKPVKLQNRTSFVFHSTSDMFSDRLYKPKKTLFSAEETIKRARSRIGEEQYSLVTNNCEHFAMWCKTGTSESGQVERIVKYAVSIGMQMQ